MGRRGVCDRHSFELSVGMPLLPSLPVQPPRDPPIFWWGDWATPSSQRGNVVFTDGSGRWSNQPEIRSCGWAFVQLSDAGHPLRACYGRLAGPSQTVGEAERVAVRRALQKLPSVDVVVTDLLGLFQEAQEWSSVANSSSGKHAAV